MSNIYTITHILLGSEATTIQTIHAVRCKPVPQKNYKIT